MDNSEILNRFDVLYNNIMSNQAPGLDAYEKSVFWNKATLEVLKNHLNPKGNKYTEGYDYSAKRQLDFGSLTVNRSYCPALYEIVSEPNGIFCKIAYRFPICSYTEQTDAQGNVVVDEETNHIVYNAEPEIDKYLCIVNEYVEELPKSDLVGFEPVITAYMNRSFASYDFNEDGRIDINDVTALIANGLSEKNQFYIAVSDKVNQIVLKGLAGVDQGMFTQNFTISDAIDAEHIQSQYTPVVPINNVEFDTLMSRPYKYPPKQQAWRLLVDGNAEIIVSPDMFPIRYNVRYIKYPAEVDLSSDVGSEVPEILHDEILQRAVELAKNSWEGTLETHKAFGERSE